MKKSLKIDIDLPEGWVDRTIYTIMGPDAGGLQHMLIISVDDEYKGQDLTEYARERIDIVEGQLPSGEIIKEEETELGNDRPAYLCIFRWNPGDKELVRKMVYALIDDVMYTFTADFTRQTHKTLGVEVDRMMAGFKPSFVSKDEE